MEQNLYKQAIVDAKAVRASAIANAKATLQEAIEPQIQKIMREKLSQELEEDEVELEEDFSELEESDYEETNEEAIDESSLDEILDELDSLEEDDSENELEESFELEEEEDELEEEEEDEEEVEDEVDVDAEETPSDDTKIIDITLGNLKDVLQSMQGMAPSQDDSEEVDSEETIGLDEVLAQLESQELEEKKHEEDELEEKKHKGKEEEELEEKMKKIEDELEEAQDAIITLNETLKELNLLNAKLLFANKILRAKNLSESEKTRVIKAFDRTRTVKETKNTYNTLMESLSEKKVKPSQQLKESIGFASQPIGAAPKTNNDIIEHPNMDRWKKIAGIK